MEGQVEQENKHQQIFGSGTRLIRRIDNLESLVNDISPRPPSKSEVVAMKEGPVTLSEFLSTEASRLDSAAARLEGLTDELRGLLF